MSKPRNKWWGYAINCVKAYPVLREKYCQGRLVEVQITG